MGPQELTDLQVERQDCVDNLIQNLLNDLAMGREVEWDIAMIAEVREVIAVNFDGRGIMKEVDFYPYVEC